MPATLGCTICGRTFCRNCLDADERICSDCASGQKQQKAGSVDARSPPSRRTVRRRAGVQAEVGDPSTAYQ